MSTEISNYSVDAQRALLAQLLKQKINQPTRPTPLSYGQRAWWFLHQLEPENAAYNIMLPARILSEVDVAALRRAFGGLVKRHALLRTTFFVEQGKPVQKVDEQGKIDLVVVDASGWTEEQLNGALLEESHRPFDLERGPVMRLHLFTLSDAEHVLLMTVHHIAFDLWSLVIFMHELRELYAAAKEQRTAALQPLKHQYADYVRWQEKMLNGADGARLWSYWQKQLGGELPVLNLPTFRPRRPVQTFRGEAHRFTLDAEVAHRLKALSQDTGATLYMILLAAYQVLLHRYSGQDDIIVGSLVASGRNRAEFAKLVGFFDNQIALRADLSTNPSFRQFLAQVQAVVLEGFRHQQYPFPLLVEKLQPERGSNRAPLFQTMFILQKAQLPEEIGLLGFGLGMTKARLELGELSLESVDFTRRVAGGLAGQLDMTLIVADIEGRLEASLQYNPDVFDAEMVVQMAGQFQTLLASIIANPDERVASLRLLDAEDWQCQVLEWNDTTADYSALPCLHQMLEAQAERTPEAIACIFHGQQLSYRELNRHANQVAHFLRARGVAPGVRVGICFERSLEMIVALFGVLKAGGAYVPLDPAYPKERLAFMLDDIQAPILLTQQKLVAALPVHQAQTVCLDSDWEIIASEGDENPVLKTTNLDLAYIIYTSGSTGRPKGVMINHLGAANTIADMNSRYAVGIGDRVLALSSLSFDLSVYDVLGTLAAGATIVIPNPSASPDPAHWLELIVNEQVTIWNSAPALMEMFIEYVSGRAVMLPEALRLVLMSGDWIPVKLPEQIKSHARHVQVHSLGGATEASIWSITFPIEKVDPLWKSIPYGRPMVNQSFYVLDASLQPAPVGVVGELYIGGIGVALGYHNRQELTAEKFIPDPFTAESGQRLYRTGDLGRYLPDGNIEFLGRIDGQVKVRGFRIELGEIETMLAQHPSVRENVVVTKTSASGEKQLVAYVVPKQQESAGQTDQEVSLGSAAGLLNKDELRSFLKSKLPEYMVPTVFVALDALPLTPNGKVDRNALPQPEQGATETEREFVAPRTPTEELLAGLWSQIIKVETLSVDDNFFELGGDSLLATQLITRLRSAFGVEVPLHCLFESPTLSGLAEKVDFYIHTGQDTQLPPLQPIPRDHELSLSFAQQRLWFLDQLLPGNPLYNATTAVRLSGVLNREVLERSINEIVRRHEALRTVFVEVEEQPAQVTIEELRISPNLVDLSDLCPEEGELRFQQLVAEETRKPFDLSTGPLMRVTLVRRGEMEHALLLTFHHIVYDGWSFGVFMKELSALYEAFLEGRPSPLPALAIQYADFAAWQRQWLTDEAMENHLAYWRKQLDSSPVLQLPTDRPRPEVQTFRGTRKSFILPPDLAESVKALSRHEGATFFMTLLAALQVLLFRYTGTEDVVVGSPVANRMHTDLDGLIGFFLNALPLRTELSGNPTFHELLKRVRTTALDAYAHQDLPFEKLVEELQPERKTMHTPFFKVWFALQNAPMPSMALPGLELSMMEADDQTCKFDLILSVLETKQGLVATWIYNTDLFDGTTIERLAGHYQTLLASIVAQPESNLSALEMLTEGERKQQTAEVARRQAANFEKLRSIRRKGVDLAQVSVTKTGFLSSEETLPLVIRPTTDDVDLCRWTGRNRDLIEKELSKYGAILFRDFNVNSVAAFGQFASSICPQLFGEYGDLPRAGGDQNVYASTPYPPDQMILYHNESSHMHLWPSKIMFFCDTVAQQGGETPIADCRAIYRRLDPAIKRRFEDKQLMYVRNYREGLDVSWQDFFRTTNRAEVEAYCRQANEQFEWLEDASLRTRKIRPAVFKHPTTRDDVFFNQILAHHVSTLEPSTRQSLLALFGEEGLPRNVYYGDGTPIEDSVIDEIRGLYSQTAVSFPWQQNDILLVDNVLTAHARNPFTGPRKIMVAIGEMRTFSEINSQGLSEKS
jgi:amino acid adenylation domain-containing protein